MNYVNRTVIKSIKIPFGRGSEILLSMLWGINPEVEFLDQLLKSVLLFNF